LQIFSHEDNGLMKSETFLNKTFVDEVSVSICVPIYGVAEYIERCAVSLFEQTYANIEYVFVNDCTKDTSIKILKEVISRYSERGSLNVKIISHAINRGLAAARNTALSKCSGKYVLWVDSDDYIETDAVKQLVDFMSKSHSDIIYFNAEKHDRNRSYTIRFPGNISQEQLIVSILSRKIYPYLWRFFIRRELYIYHGIKAIEGINNGEDYSVIPRLLYYAQTVTYFNVVLYNYDNSRNDSYSNTFSPQRTEQEWNATLLLENFFADKEACYKEAVVIAKLSRLTGTIKGICMRGGNREDFNLLKKKQKQIGNRHWKEITVGYLPLLFIDNFTVACMYVRISSFLKLIIDKLQRMRFYVQKRFDIHCGSDF